LSHYLCVTAIASLLWFLLNRWQLEQVWREWVIWPVDILVGIIHRLGGIDKFLSAYTFLITANIAYFFIGELAGCMGVCPARAGRAGPQRAPDAAARQRAQQNWDRLRTLVRRRIILVLRIRRVWNQLGIWLQQDWVQDLVEGLDRRRGVLRRVAPAPLGLPGLRIRQALAKAQAKAKARARQ